MVTGPRALSWVQMVLCTPVILYSLSKPVSTLSKAHFFGIPKWRPELQGRESGPLILRWKVKMLPFFFEEGKESLLCQDSVEMELGV